MYMDINAIHMSTSAGAVVAATFAGAGMNPFSYKKIASTEAVRQTLSMMVSCGMNSYSGAFAFEVTE